jgi:apolipoprotein N-acyltransferase
VAGSAERAAPAGWIAARGRWGRLPLAVLAGAAMTLGQPPVSHPWALFLALPVLVWLVDAAPGPRAAALVGWGAAFGYFVSGLYWIGHAFLVDAERFAWMMPFAVALLPAFLGLFWAAAFGLARHLWPVERWWRPLALASALTLAEYARAHVLTGFPWALPGYAWVETSLMQAAAWVGPFGMTLVTLALVPLPLLCALERRPVPGLAALGVLGALWLAGAARLETAPSEGGGPVLRVVQPNAEQRLKWRPEYSQLFYERLLEATAAPADPALGPPAAVIWPETAVPFLPAYQPGRRAEIAAAAGGVPVILGALHGEPGGGRDRYFNSVMVIRPGGGLGDRYDKHHLVPFGEYLPYPWLLAPLGFEKLVPGAGFTPGPGPQLMRVEGLPPFSPLVCYEMIFPGEVVPQGTRPDWLLQVTNDAWFGSWGGPQQHLAQARIRAIEQGLPVIRAANTGISAAIDAHGRLVASLAMLTAGHFDVALPVPLLPTLYARTGDVPAMALVVLGLVICARLGRGRDAGARPPGDA